MKKLETKEVIKKAAFEILTKKLDYDLNMRSIQAVTNYSPGTIYYYYHSKTEIILDLVDDYWTSVLHNFSLDINNNDILTNLKLFYEALSEKFKFFEEYFVPTLIQLSYEDKSIGKDFELNHLKNIKLILNNIIEYNIKEINKEVINKLDKEYIIDFVYRNFISSLKLNNDINNYLYIIEKLLLR